MLYKSQAYSILAPHLTMNLYNDIESYNIKINFLNYRKRNQNTIKHGGTNKSYDYCYFIGLFGPLIFISDSTIKFMC